MEKKKLIEEKKQYLEIRKSRNQQTRFVIESIQSVYRQKLDLLREKQFNEQHERQLIQRAQKEVSFYLID